MMNGTFAMFAVEVAQQGSVGGVWRRQAVLRASNWVFSKSGPSCTFPILLLAVYVSTPNCQSSMSSSDQDSSSASSFEVYAKDSHDDSPDS